MGDNKWKEYTVKEVLECNIDYRGKTPPKSDFGIKTLTAGNIKDGKIDFTKGSYISEETYRKWLTRGLPLPGDVLITTEAPVGEVASFPSNDKYLITRRLIALRGDSKIILNNFLKYIFLNPYDKKRLLRATRGSTVPRVLKDDILDFKIKVPSLNEQKRILGLLANIDEKIEVNNQMNQTLEEMAQAIFKEWFVEFNFPNEDGVPYKDNGGEMEESELGMIPKGWKVEEASKAFNINIGKTPPRKEKEWFSFDNNDIKWLSIKDMGKAGTFILNTSEYLTQEAIEKHNVKIVPKDTVVLSFKLTVGRLGITNVNMVTNEAIAHFNIKDNEEMTKEYIYSYLKTFNYESLGSTSSIAKAVNSKVIKAMPIILPDNKTMEIFIEKVANIFEIIRKKQEEANTLIKTRDTLLPKLMSGEVRVL